MNVIIVIYVKVFLICILCKKSIYICKKISAYRFRDFHGSIRNKLNVSSSSLLIKLNIKTNKMELGTKYKFKEGSIGTLIEKNKNYGLFKFEDGSQFVFNLNKLT